MDPPDPDQPQNVMDPQHWGTDNFNIFVDWEYEYNIYVRRFKKFIFNHCSLATSKRAQAINNQQINRSLLKLTNIRRELVI